ncbi:MAG: TfuA-like protein [Alsobacter sp.]
MTVVVFLGPSLPAAEALAVLPDATILPPVAQGDLYRAVLDHEPDAMGVIDGTFHQTASVWHREILFALSRGVPVFGGASMGALRAAELHAFGMRGVGRIFEAYRDGRFPGLDGPFESDDEVAVVHGPAELGWPALSDAMVDIRHLCAEAAARGVLDAQAASRLVEAAQAQAFPERSLAALVEDGAALGLDEGRRTAMEAWLAAAPPGLKRLDALAVLGALRDWQAQGAPAHAPDFRFEEPSAWLAFVAGETRRRAGLLTPDEADVLDAARLDRENWGALRRRALLRLSARHPAARPEPALAELRRALDRWREARGLAGPGALERWLAENALAEAGLVRLLQDEIRCEALAGELAPLRHAVLDEIRLEGRFARLLARGRDVRGRAEAASPAQGPFAGPAASLLLDKVAGAGDLSGASYSRERLFYAFDSDDALEAWLWRWHAAGRG